MSAVRLAGRVEAPVLESKVLVGNLPGDPTERMLPIYLPPGYDAATGGIDSAGLAALVSDRTAAVYAEVPSYLGIVDPAQGTGDQ